MPYDPKSDTAEEIRQRRGKNDPSPEEIAEWAAAIRAGWVDENGVLIVFPCNEGGRERQKKYQPGIREVKGPARSGRPRPE